MLPKPRKPAIAVKAPLKSKRVSPPHTPPLCIITNTKANSDTEGVTTGVSSRDHGSLRSQSPPKAATDRRAESRERVKAALAKVYERIAEKESLKRQKAMSPKATMTNIESIWVSACRKHLNIFPMPWRVAEKSMVKKLKARLETNGQTPGQFIELLEWSVQHWVDMRSSAFAWMTDSPPPAMPSIPFFVRWVERFMEYMQRPALLAANTKRAEHTQAMVRQRQKLKELDAQVRAKEEKLRSLKPVAHVTPEAVASRVNRFRTALPTKRARLSMPAMTIPTYKEDTDDQK